MANNIPLAIADVELQLSTALSVGDTSFSLSSATDDDGEALPAGMYCFTVDRDSSAKEYLLGQLNGTNVTSVVSVSRQGVESSGAARAHRIGATVVLTDFATLQRVADILRGTLTLDSANPISYDSEPTLSDNAELATVGYVLSVVTGGDVSFDKQTIAGTAGEAIVAGDTVYFNESDQEWYKTNGATAATVEGVMRGIALGTGSDGAAISGGVHLAGAWTTSGLTAGSVYYASDTAGARATTAGTIPHVVGVALSTTVLWVIPHTRETLATRTKAALVGTSGTPSTSNKFVTNDDTDGTGDVLRASKHTKLISAIDVNDTFGGAASNPEENIVSVEIPAGALGTNNMVRVKAYVTSLTTDSNSNVNDFILYLKYGATTLATLTIGHSANGGVGGIQNGYIEAVLFANASTSSQLGDLQLQVHPKNLGSGQTLLGGMGTATGAASEDSTIAKNLILSVDPANDADVGITISHAIVELITS